VTFTWSKSRCCKCESDTTIKPSRPCSLVILVVLLFNFGLSFFNLNGKKYTNNSNLKCAQ